jgi:hypothetical protein
MLRTLAVAAALTPLVLLQAAPAMTSAASSAPPARALASVAGTGVGIRLLDVPIDSEDDPRARSYIVDHMTPGSTIQRRVQIVNNSATTQSVHIYSGAAEIVGAAFTPIDVDENDVTRWTSFDQDVLEMDPMESADVLVTVEVPSDAAEGEQYGAVWAEVRSSSGTVDNVVTASRVGIRMYLSVGPGNGPAANFQLGPLGAAITGDGTRVLSVTVSNTGGRAVDLDGTLDLADGPAGLSAGPFHTHDVLTLAPGDSGQLTVRLDDEIPAGPWAAKLEVRSGLVAREMSEEILFSTARQTQKEWEFGLPLMLAAGTLALGVAAGVFVAERRRRRRTGPSEREIA